MSFFGLSHCAVLVRWLLSAECPVPSAGSGSLQTTAEEDIYMKPACNLFQLASQSYKEHDCFMGSAQEYWAPLYGSHVVARMLQAN